VDILNFTNICGNNNIPGGGKCPVLPPTPGDAHDANTYKLYYIIKLIYNSLCISETTYVDLWVVKCQDTS
jgi:hypothetical protein